MPPESVTSSVITSPERLLSVSSATRSEASEDIMCLSGKSCPVIFVSIYTPTTCYPPLRFPISASATIQSVGESMSILRSRGIIPGRNIKPLCGKPLIAYSIESALALAPQSRVIVTTDSDDIAACARKYGVDNPYMRPDRSSVTPASSALRTSPSVRVPTILPPESVTSSVITSPERLTAFEKTSRSAP